MMRTLDKLPSVLRQSAAIMIAGFALSLSVWAQLPASPEEAPGVSAADLQNLTIGELSPAVAKELAILRDLQSYPSPESVERREALEIRKDQKTLSVLRSLMALGNKVLKLPEEAPERETLRQLLILREVEIEQTFEERIASLQERLTDSLARVAELSGPALLIEQAKQDLIDQQRLAYLELMVELSLLQEGIGLDAESLTQKAIWTLHFAGEQLMGLVKLHTHSLEVLGARQTLDNTDQAVIQAAITERDKLQTAINALQRVVDQLERLDGATVEMRRVLIDQKGGMALNLVDTDILSALYAETISNFRAWLHERGLSSSLSIILFIAIVIVSRVVARLSRRLVQHALDTSSYSVSQLLRETLISVTGTVVLILGILVAFAQIGVSIAPIVAGLGVVGFIVGFALQDTISNFFSGVMILVYRPFDTEDFISAANVEGTVKKMNLATTTILTVDNRTLIVPNRQIWGGVIMNYTGQALRRTDIMLGVSYGEDLDHVQRVLEELVEANEYFVKDPEPMVRAKEFGESSINFMIRAYVRTPDYWEGVFAFNKSVKRRFDEEGITIPFPQRDLHIKGATPDQSSPAASA